MPDIERWRDLELSSDAASRLMVEVGGLARRVSDRLEELGAQPERSSNYARDSAWCREVAANLVTAKRVLKSLLVDMPERWQA